MPQQYVDKKGRKVKFIRVRGRVVPIPAEKYKGPTNGPRTSGKKFKAPKGYKFASKAGKKEYRGLGRREKAIARGIHAQAAYTFSEGTHRKKFKATPGRALGLGAIGAGIGGFLGKGKGAILGGVLGLLAGVGKKKYAHTKKGKKLYKRLQKAKKATKKYGVGRDEYADTQYRKQSARIFGQGF